jgi:ABC-type branched-subunit amino acid transport system permease subunit
MISQLNAIAGLLSTWITYFAAFYCAALGCGVLVRRGFLPLHLSAVTGISAYAFAASCGHFHSFPAAVAVALSTSAVFSLFVGSIFSRVRAASAALASIAIQLIFEEHVRTASWTGGSQGLWQGIPAMSPFQRVVLAAVLLAICSQLYRLFGHTTAARRITADGLSGKFYQSVSVHSAVVPILVANLLVGLLGGCAGILLALQIGLVAPATFSLYFSILYVSVILLVGYANLASIAFGSFILGVLPEVLRFTGLGTVNRSAWQGLIVGALLLSFVVLQLPRWNLRTSAVLTRGKS